MVRESGKKVNPLKVSIQCERDSVNILMTMMEIMECIRQATEYKVRCVTTSNFNPVQCAECAEYSMRIQFSTRCFTLPQVTPFSPQTLHQLHQSSLFLVAHWNNKQFRSIDRSMHAFRFCVCFCCLFLFRLMPIVWW